MEEVLGRVLVSDRGNVETDNVRPRFLLVYFSAHWCGPCRKFTPQLKMFYESVNSSETVVEIIYISKDKTPEEFSSYFQSMPWLAMPYEDTEGRKNLSRRLGVNSIPTLILLDPSGNVKSRTCRNDVVEKGPSCLEDWALI
jgi:nucleoredoxin